MDVYEEIVRLRREGRKGALATIVNVRGSIPSFETAKMLVRDDGTIVGTIGGGCVEAEVWQAAKEVMASEKPRTLKFDLNNDPKYDTGLVCGGTLEVFVEPVAPAPHLYIFGAGHVAHSLYKVARVAGFEVTVAAGPGIVNYPMFIAFDDRGRLFVCESAGRNISDQEMDHQSEMRIRLANADSSIGLCWNRTFQIWPHSRSKSAWETTM